MKRRFTASIIILASLNACQTIDEIPTDRLGHASLYFANGLPAGTAQLLGSGSQVNISIGLVGMQSGSHAVRLHTVGSCVGLDFTSAGDPLSSDGSLLGELPNARVGSAGAGTVSASLPGDRMDVLRQLFDEDGASVVIYDGTDADSGSKHRRIACGVLTPR